MGQVERLRFAFAITTGPNEGLGCGGWRIWTHGDSTYIGGKGNPWKASLHGDSSWRIAPTSDHVRQHREPIIPGGRDTNWEFEPTNFTNGLRYAFAIGVTRNCLVPQRPASNETVIEVADRWDQLTVLNVWITETDGTFDVPVIGGPHR